MHYLTLYIGNLVGRELILIEWDLGVFQVSEET